MRHPSAGQRGFTLIEMMTVLAIIAILTVVLASVASPAAGTPRTSSEEAVGLIQFARLRAESTRVVHAVRFEANQTISVWEATVSAVDPTPRVGYDLTGGDWALVQSIALPPNAKLFAAYPTSGALPAPVAGDNLPFEIRFFPDGGTNTSGTVLIGDQNTNSTAFKVVVYRTTGGSIAREGW